MPDPQRLAEALVLLLAQALPSLLSQEAEKQAGATVSGKVKEIWERLRGKVEEKEAAQEAAEDLAQMPAGEDRRAALRRQLVKILSADPDLVVLLEPLVEAARSEVTVTRVQAGDQGVAVGRDVHGNVIVINPTAGPLAAEEVLRWLGRERAPAELKKVAAPEMSDESKPATPSQGFDVFLSHNSKDKPSVRQLKKLLVERNLTVWLDADELRPGIPWQRLLEDGIRKSKSVAVLVGNDGLGPWASEEMEAVLRLAVKDGRPVIPVLLPGAPDTVQLPLFLENRTWVDLRPEMTPQELDRLVWGITDKKPDPPKQPSEELKRITDRYLQYLVERYRYLDFRGLGISDRIPLQLPLLRMYIPLHARIETPEGETWERLRVAGRKLSEEEAEGLGRGAGASQPVLELLQTHSGLILLGDPGAGKTTFLKFLALTLATGQGEHLGLGELLPVLVPLAAYAEDLAHDDVPLLGFLARYSRHRGVPLPLDEILGPALVNGKVLLLLDGLDEVKNPEHRHLLVERVKDFYSFHKDAGNKFVLTSRIVGYREVRPEAPGLAEATLVDLEDEEIEVFIERWTAALERAASGATAVAELDAAREREELLAAVRENPGVRALATNPLLLTILAVMKRQGVSLPERRVALYQTCVETLLRHWNLARSLSGRSVAVLDEVEVLKILAPLALWMHEVAPGIGLVREWDLRQKLEALCRDRGEPDAEGAARRFLDDVHKGTALLLDRGGGQYGFIHLTFQEYLAGVALAKLAEQEVAPLVTALADHVDDAAWREVLLLAIGYLGIVQKRDVAAGAVLEKLIQQAPEPPGAAVVLAGRAVADMRAGGVTPACRQKVVEELLTTMRSDRVDARRRAEAGFALAELGDPRVEVMTLDGMEFCRVPAGPFRMGSEADDEAGYDDERPAHDLDVPYKYCLGRYPVTVAQFRTYAEESGQFQDRDRLKGPANAPMVRVSWDEALAFCRWLTVRWRDLGRIEPGWGVALPSEAEWEKAARGEDGRIYPWGPDPDPNRMSYAETGIGAPSPAGCFPLGASPYGCEEMSGNVWEWTRSLWGKNFSYPYQIEDGRENLEASSEALRVLRGGAFISDSWVVRCAFRHGFEPWGRSWGVGFRLVLLPFSSDL
jgi:formylglycine-generating enzyme required for sulfatase activity